MTIARTIKLITFDLDHTLWNPDEAIAQGEQHSFAWLCEQNSAFAQHYTLDMMRRLRQSMADEHYLQHRISTLRQQSVHTALQIVGVDENEAAALSTEAFRIFLHHRNQVQLFAQTDALLAALQPHCILGAISNGNACLEAIGLRHYFAFHYTAEQFNAKKPLPQQFEAALRFANCGPANAVHIGDHPVDDIHGAAALGIRTLWYNPAQTPWNTDHSPFTPTAIVRSLADIPALLATWSPT